MQGKISMDLSFCQSETGFSLDELVTKLADVYERKAFAELLKMILQMVQEILIHRLLHGRLDALKCCDRGHFRLNGSFERRIRTSLGEFKMPFWRVSCSDAVLASELFRVRSNLFAIAAVHSPGTLSDENQ